MKILGKNVIIGTKKLCIEYTSKINKESNDCFLGSNEYKGDVLEKNVLFVRDKNGYLVELKEMGSFPTLSLICFGAAQRWRTSPKNAGDYYVDNIRPYFAEHDQNSIFELKELVSTAKVFATPEYQSTLTNE